LLSFFNVNDEKEVDIGNLKSSNVCFVTTILCMFLIQAQKKENDILFIMNIWSNNFEKTCGWGSCYNCQKIEYEVNVLIKGTFEKQLVKKRPNVSSNAKFNFFAFKDPFLKGS